MRKLRTIKLLAQQGGKVFKLFFISVLVFISIQSYAVDCSKMYEEQLKSVLNLTYDKFDQTKKQGFRVLSEASCYKEGADLLEKYIAHNNAKENSLRWHVAQLRAMSGDYPRAISSSILSLRPNENLQEYPLRWNDYVLATLAFLQHKKEVLIAHRNEVAKGVDDFIGNKMNLKLLDKLILNFDQTYEYAVNHE